jgi:hypothetical protein
MKSMAVIQAQGSKLRDRGSYRRQATIEADHLPADEISGG